MKPFDIVLVPIFPSEGERRIRRTVQNGLLLSEWLDVPVRILLVGDSSSPARQWAIQQAWQNDRVRSVSLSGKPGHLAELLREVSAFSHGLVVLAADPTGFFGSSQALKREKSAFVERCQLPVWIIPARMALSAAPASSVLVALSGEYGGGGGLELAVRLGNLKRLPVDILHVTSSRPSREFDPSVIAQVRDQFHHEYHSLVQELLAQACPYLGPHDCSVIREFCHSIGDVRSEIRSRVRGRSDRLIVLEWKGSLERGRARKIKLMIRRARTPLLLVHESGAARSRLRIGRDFGLAR